MSAERSFSSETPSAEWPAGCASGICAIATAVTVLIPEELEPSRGSDLLSTELSPELTVDISSEERVLRSRSASNGDTRGC